jgi:DnaJ-domain-containing protein 1
MSWAFVAVWVSMKGLASAIENRQRLLAWHLRILNCRTPSIAQRPACGCTLPLRIKLAQCKKASQNIVLLESWITMAAPEFIDYYEILEISPNANTETIERIFRYLAQRYHPDNRDTGDRARFDVVIEAHDTLKDPIKRAQYDLDHKNRSNLRSQLVDEINGRKSIGRGVDIQDKLLSVLYVKCRQNVREPGIGDVELERLSGCPTEHLEFHLWYLKEKGWIRKTENGTYAITVDGVDRANSEYHQKTTPHLLADQSHIG